MPKQKEVAVLRLAQARADGRPLPQGPLLRMLAKAQGHFAGFAHWWR